jgi:hypothetical protein
VELVVPRSRKGMLQSVSYRRLLCLIRMTMLCSGNIVFRCYSHLTCLIPAQKMKAVHPVLGNQPSSWFSFFVCPLR